MEISFAGSQTNTPESGKFCNEVVSAFDRNPSEFPDWYDKTILWFKQGFVSCDEITNGAINLANRGFITGEIQQDIQLVALGRSTTQRSEEIIRLSEELAKANELRESQRLEDQLAAQKDLDRINRQLEELGISQQDNVNSDFFTGVATFLGGAGIGGSIVAIAVIAVLLKRR